MLIYLVIGIVMFVVGFIAGIYWATSKVMSALDDAKLERNTPSYGSYRYVANK